MPGCTTALEGSVRMWSELLEISRLLGEHRSRWLFQSAGVSRHRRISNRRQMVRLRRDRSPSCELTCYSCCECHLDGTFGFGFALQGRRSHRLEGSSHLLVDLYNCLCSSCTKISSDLFQINKYYYIISLASN